MKKVIEIKARTSITSISESWSVTDQDDEIEFQISKSSSFMLFAEGVALAYLQEYLLLGKSVAIRLHLSANKINKTELDRRIRENSWQISDLNIPSVLCGIFGLQLLYQSKNFYDALGKDSDPKLARNDIGSIIWKFVQKRKGLLGDGKSQYLVSRHDYRIPALLRTDDSKKFPTSDQFRFKLSKIIGSIGNEKVSSIDAKTLISSWIYHMAENAYEHGALPINDNESILNGFSGILIQKIATPNRGMIKSRHDLDEATKQYIQNLYDNHRFKNSDTLTIITVMDGGQGIQNTLPDMYKDYSSVGKLNVAYKRGVTRHEHKEGNSGYGLYDSIRAAKKLNACISVCSGNIYTCQMFESIKGESMEFDKNFIELSKSIGTSQSIIWPSTSKQRKAANG